jgi:hypothetical protein
MRPMPTRRRHTLIVGLVMTFAGPALGYLIRDAMSFPLTRQPPLPSSLADAMHQYEAVMAKVFSVSMIGEIGMICGAIGVLVSAAALARHFWPDYAATSTKSTTVPHVPAAPRPATRPVFSDAKYMPRYSYGPNP